MRSGVHAVCNDLHDADAAARPSVLFLVDQLTELGGGERVLFELARRLPAHGFAVSVVSFRSRPDPAVFDLCDNIDFMPLRTCFGIEAARVAWRLRRLICDRHVEIVHTFFETADLYGSLVAKLSGVRHILSSRRDMGILRSGKHHLAYRLFGPMYSGVLAVSQQVRTQHMKTDRLRPDRVKVIYNGIDPARFAQPQHGLEARASMGIPEGARLVSTIANINPWKGIDVFLRCAAEVARARQDTYFAIAGDFTDVALATELLKLTGSLNLRDRVRFLGRVPDVRSLLHASDVFCLLSRTEGLPNVVLEAMACALPTVATRVGGTPEVVDEGLTGFLVENEDHAAAAQRVLALLAHPAARHAMGQAAQERVMRDFTIQTMIQKHVEIYDSFLRR
jgi:glycosyltransferase involved in cell wall biosynthesis